MALPQNKKVSNVVSSVNSLITSEISDQSFGSMRYSNGSLFSRNMQNLFRDTPEDTPIAGSDTPTNYLKSVANPTSAYTSDDLGYIEITPEHQSNSTGIYQSANESIYIKPGGRYKLMFDMYCLTPWQFFVSDKINSTSSNTDILPGVIISSPTAGTHISGGGNQPLTLMSNDNWVVGSLPLTGTNLSPFVNIIDNGDFHDITAASLVVNSGGGLPPGTESVTTDGGTPSDGNHQWKIFLANGTAADGTMPGENFDDTLGLCTDTDGQDLKFKGLRGEMAGQIVGIDQGIQNPVIDNAVLYTLDGWKAYGNSGLPGGAEGPSLIWYDWLSTNMTYSDNNYTFGIQHLDGGRNGSSVLKMSACQFIIESYANTDNTTLSWQYYKQNYLYQDIVLDGRCYYDLHIRYLTSAVRSIHSNTNSGFFDEHAVNARLAYDIQYEGGSLDGDSLIGGWKFADENSLSSDLSMNGSDGDIAGSAVNLRHCESNSYYAHNGQYYDELSDTIKFDYQNFYVPGLSGGGTDQRTIRLKLSVFVPFDNIADPGHSNSVYLSYVSVKKAFPDLVQLTRKTSLSCPARGLMRGLSTTGLECHGEKYFDRWQRYHLDFTAPDYYADSDVGDWTIKIYGGHFGTTKTTKSALITAVTRSGSLATYQTNGNHGLSEGDRITISGTTNYNDANFDTTDKNVVNNVPGSTSFKVKITGTPADETGITANVELVNSSNYINKQVVGVRNVKLIDYNYKSGEEFSDNVIVLPDNIEASNSTNLTLYHVNAKFWDSAFYTIPTAKFAPVYSYVNGTLQISDSDFTNNNLLLRWFWIERDFLNGTSLSEYVLTDNVFPTIGTVSVSQEVTAFISSHTIDFMPILANTFTGGDNGFGWGSGFQFWPLGTTFVCFNPSNNTEAPWHYRWFTRGNAMGGVLPNGLMEEASTIPIKYIPEVFTSRLGDGNLNNTLNLRTGWSTHPGGNYIHELAAAEDLTGATLWKSGGPQTYQAHANTSHGTDGTNQLDWFEEQIGLNQAVNNPVWIPIMGSNGIPGSAGADLGSWSMPSTGEKDRREAIVTQIINGGDAATSPQIAEYWAARDPYHVSNISFTIDTRITVVRSIDDMNPGNHNIWSNSEHTSYKTIDCMVPKVKVSVYKYHTANALANMNLDISMDQLNNLFLAPEGQISPELITSYVSGPSPMSIGTYAESEPLACSYEYTGTPNGRYSDGGFVAIRIKYPITLTFPADAPNPSVVNSDESFVLKIEYQDGFGNQLSNTDYNSVLARVGMNYLEFNGDGGPEMEVQHDYTTQFGFDFWSNDSSGSTESPDEFSLKPRISFYAPGTTSTGDAPCWKDISLNFNFKELVGETTDSWVARVFTVGVTTVNIFGEESAIYDTGFTVGSSIPIEPGFAPDISCSIGADAVNHPLINKIKIYLKDAEADIWYAQIIVDTKTGLIKSTTSGKEYTSVMGNEEYYLWEIKAEDMLFYNEVDSYEAETLVNQEDAKSQSNLICTYKTSVHVNNRLYVGNIKQNGKSYGDRMIKTPIGKYNVFPESNFIDVAIVDGDEITALSYFKDKLLQFKKKKVFVINVAGDYEFLEDTFDNIGVNKQCQIATTPYGICWVNAGGCFLYDGKELRNLIDKKIGAQSFQSNIDGNDWFIKDIDSPAIGYIKDTKKLIISRSTGYKTKIVNDTTTYPTTSIPDGFTYDFQSEGWTFLFQKLTGTQDDNGTTNMGLMSNFVNNQDGDVLFYAVSASEDGGTDINALYIWDDSPITSKRDIDVLTFKTKDYDFGAPGVRKKIYKVYVTFKSKHGTCNLREHLGRTLCEKNDGTWTEEYAHSNVTVKYAVNGSSTSALFNDGTNYSASNGLYDSGSGTEWTVAELKPAASINNVYSFQLQFIGAGNIPNGFEINDITIIYRVKNIK